MSLSQFKGVWKIKTLQMNHNEQSDCLGTVSPLNDKSVLLEKKLMLLKLSQDVR